MTISTLRSQDMLLCAHDITFRVINNDGPALQEAFRLRYKIYCQEKKYLSKDGYSADLEMDEYDHNSIHIGAFDQKGSLLGYARLVLPHWKKRLPMHQQCSFFPPQTAFSNSRYLQSAGCAEISRIVVRKDVRAQEQGRLLKFFRRYFGRTKFYKSIKSLRSLLSGRICVALGLYKMILFVAEQENINHLLAVIEKPYARHLKFYNVHFQQIGPFFDYGGAVAPHIIDARATQRSFCRNNRLLHWYFFRYIRASDKKDLAVPSLPEIAA